MHYYSYTSSSTLFHETREIHDKNLRQNNSNKMHQAEFKQLIKPLKVMLPPVLTLHSAHRVRTCVPHDSHCRSVFPVRYELICLIYLYILHKYQTSVESIVGGCSHSILHSPSAKKRSINININMKYSTVSQN